MAKMLTFQFENGTELQFPSLGHALEHAHKRGTRIVRYC